MGERSGPFVILTRDGVADPGQEDEIAALRARIAEPGAKLLLHLHGGLVDEVAGSDAARRLGGPAPAGWGLGEDWTQVYVVWRTGVWETLRTNWLETLHNDRLYRTVLGKLIEFVAGKLGIPGEAVGRSAATGVALDPEDIQARLDGTVDPDDPFGAIDATARARGDAGVGRTSFQPLRDDATLASQFESFLARDRDFNAVVGDIDAGINVGAVGRVALSAGDAEAGVRSYALLDARIREPVEELRPDLARGRASPVSVGMFLLKHAGNIAFNCFKRFRAGRDHGFHATLVEEVAREMYGDLVGATIWGMMTRDAADHFVDRAGRRGFGLELVDALPDGPSRIVVTGHSAGSIWASHLLLALKASGKPVEVTLVLLAPAVRADVFAGIVEEAGDLVRSCHMFTMTDAAERADAVLGERTGYVYPSSLLYMVSGLFEERKADAFVDAPILGMQRYVGADWLDDADQERAQATVAAFFAREGNAITFGPVEGVTDARSHGAFDDDEATLRSVAALFG